jgi:hypothetical protein
MDLLGPHDLTQRIQARVIVSFYSPDAVVSALAASFNKIISDAGDA